MYDVSQGTLWAIKQVLEQLSCAILVMSIARKSRTSTRAHSHRLSYHIELGRCFVPHQKSSTVPSISISHLPAYKHGATVAPLFVTRGEAVLPLDENAIYLDFYPPPCMSCVPIQDEKLSWTSLS